MTVSFTLNLKFDESRIKPSNAVVSRKGAPTISLAPQGTGLRRGQLKNLADGEQLTLKVTVPDGPTITQKLMVMRAGDRAFVQPAKQWSRYLALEPTVSVNAAQVTLDLAPVTEFETRKILFAQGIQFTNADLSPMERVPDALTAAASARKSWPDSFKCLKDRAPLTLSAQGTQVFEFTSNVQRVIFHVEVVMTKQELINALRTKDMHVIYDGHARYGRGPCFGSNDARGDNWENGTDPPAGAPSGAPGVNTGIFRMGYPFMAVPVVMDVLEHGYHVNLADPTVTLDPAQCEELLRNAVAGSQVKTWTVGDVDNWLQTAAGQKVLKTANRPLTSRFSDQVLGNDLTKKLRYFMSPDDGVQPFVVIRAGWNDTPTAPSNIGVTDLNCRVFNHFGCDTRRHNRAILRDRPFKAWPKDGDRGFAYFTTSISAGPTTVYWLYHLFTFPKLNNFADWKPSLDYALDKSNQDIASVQRLSSQDANDPMNGVSFRLAEI